jgi:NTP pyrophosphatase (non-canonical NTP hydrolase)
MEVRELAQAIHKVNVKKGFWDKERNVGEMLMLVVSELGEAIEAHRKNKFADLEHFEDLSREMEGKKAFEIAVKDTFEDEIADAVIRLLDMSAGLNIDIQRHIWLKIGYNATRLRLHGKSY